MQYKIEMVYERADFIGFMKAFNDRDKKLRIMGLLSTYGVKMGSALLLFGGVFNFVDMYRNGAFDIKLAAASVALVVIAFLLSAIPLDELPGRRAWNNYALQGMKITYDFEAGGFTETRQGNPYKHNYKDIQSLYMDDERYYLFISNASAYILCKRGFKEGDAESFVKYIENKTGLTMESKDDPAAQTTENK